MDNDFGEICGWRFDLESSTRGEFWIDREALTQRMSNLSPNERSLYRLRIVEKFNQGLEEILVQDQAVGEMRDDFRDR